MFADPLHFKLNALFLGLLLFESQSFLFPFPFPFVLHIAVLRLPQSQSSPHHRIPLQLLCCPLVTVVHPFILWNGVSTISNVVEQCPSVFCSQCFHFILCFAFVLEFAALSKDEHFNLSLAIMFHDGRVHSHFVRFRHCSFVTLRLEPHDELLSRTRDVSKVTLDISIGARSARRSQSDAVVRHGVN